MSTMIRGASHTGGKTSEESAVVAAVSAMHDERRRRRMVETGVPLSLIIKENDKKILLKRCVKKASKILINDFQDFSM